MPRSHVSVARFYDWSEDLGDCFSVSRLYREIASIPRVPPDKDAMKINGQLASSVGINTASISVNSNRQLPMSPGRMFIRDKKALTRGEREIIEGIYRNRGDVSARDAIIKSEFQVKSHQEAWFAGKYPSENFSYGRVSLQGEKINGKSLKSGGPTDSEGSISSPISDGSKNDEAVSPKPSNSPESWNYLNRTTGFKVKISTDDRSSPSCYMCQYHRDTHDVAKRTMKAQSREGYWDSRPSAPPSTPDQSDKPLTTQQTPTFDKLLGMRPSLSPNSVLFAEKVRVFNGHTDSEHAVEPKPTMSRLKPNKPTPEEKVGWASDDLSVISMQSEQNVPFHQETSKSRAYRRPVSHQKEVYSDTQRDNDSVSSYNGQDSDEPPWAEEHEEESDDSNRGRKKVKVKVYLPTAGTDHIDDDLSTVSLTKERPLSHKEFRIRNHQKSSGEKTRSRISSHGKMNHLVVNSDRDQRAIDFDTHTSASHV